LRHFIRKVFGIFPGEEKNVFRFIKLAIVWAIGSCIAETLAVGLFTERVGAAYLPNTYVMTALTMISVSCLYMYFLRFVSPYRIMITTMSIAAVAYTGIAITLFTNPPLWFWYFLRVFSHTFEISLIACFWIFLDHYHDLQDAKRLFGVYNAAYFIGYIISGTLINLAYAKLGPAVLFSIIVFTMTHSILEARKITKTVPAMEDDLSEDYFSGGKKTFASIFKEFYKSPYVLFMVSMSLVVQLLRTCTEYTYLESIEKAFRSSAHIFSDSTIPAFLGKCKAWASAFNILLGVFVYRNLITRIGITNLILIPPIYFLTLYCQWSLFDSLLIAILGVIAVECILFTLEDNNFNLLINAAPAKLRGILRLINDSFFEPLGMLLSALFLLLLHNQNKVLGLTLSVVFIVLSIIVKYFYPKSIFKVLKEHSIHFERKTKDWIKLQSAKERRETKQVLLNALDAPDENTKLLAIKTLLDLNDTKILTKILLTISNLSSNIKIKALKILEESLFSNDANVIDFVNDINEYASEQDLINVSHFYLAKNGLIHPKRAKIDLDSQNLILRASAIYSLKHCKSNDTIANASLNRTIAQKELQLLFNFGIIDEICMGLKILQLDDSDEAVAIAIKYLSHENMKIKQKAAKTLAKITDKSDSKYASSIMEEIKLTSDTTFRLYLLDALGNIADSTTIKNIIKLSIHFRPIAKRRAEEIISKMGLKTVPILTSIVKDITFNERARILAAKILAKLSLAQLRNNLDDIVSKEIQKAHFYFYYAHTIQKKYPLYDLSLLTKALHSGFQSIVDFIVHILSEASLMEDCELIAKALRIKTTKSHAHAMETLEKNVNRKFFKKIKPLIDDIPTDYQLEQSAKLLDSKLNLKELLDRLENSHLFFDSIIAVHLKAKLKMPNWQKTLREKIKQSDDKFHQFTYELLEL